MKRKILFVIPTLHGGGAERVISSLFLNLNYKKYDLDLLVFDGSKRKYLKKNKIIDLKSKSITSGFFKFIFCIYKLKPDVIISTVSHLNLFVSVIRIFLPQKTKIILRESNFISNNLRLQANQILMKVLYQIFYNNIDKCIVFSSNHRLDVLKNTNLDKKKIKIIGNPIDFKKINILSNKRIDIKLKSFFSKKKKNLIIVGSLSYQKGIDIILKSLKYCNKDFNLNIIGSGSLRKKLSAMIYKDKLTSKVNLIPFQNNPFPYIKFSDALIFPSRFEGMSNVVLETLAIRKPIFYFNNLSASTDILKKIKGNFMFKKKTPKYIAKIIDQIKRKKKIKDSALLRKFSLKNIIKNYENLIDNDLF